MTDGPPTEKLCHINTDRRVQEHPDHKAVHGWLVLDYSEGLMPLCGVTAHSVVETPDGQLFDLTPSSDPQRPPFLRHKGPDGEFEAIVLDGGSNLRFP